MSTNYTEAPSSVIHTAEQLISQYHPHLQDARIAFVMRNEAPVTNGRETMANASKVTAINQTLMEYDFLIWIAEDSWTRITSDQKEALIDHELMHCAGDSRHGWYMRHHDIEEFNDIIERHGMWKKDLVRMANAVRQLRVPFGETEMQIEYKGKVVSLTGEQLDRLANQYEERS